MITKTQRRWLFNLCELPGIPVTGSYGGLRHYAVARMLKRMLQRGLVEIIHGRYFITIEGMRAIAPKGKR